MTVIDDVLAANDAYAAGFDKGDLPMPPARKLVVIACMDARLDPAKILGLEEGDAHVIRNAGGRASEDALRSLVISQQLLGTREVIFVHHTDCGMLTFDNEGFRSQLQETFGYDAGDIDFLPFKDAEKSTLEDVQTVRNHPLVIPGTPVRGYIYDVKTGRLHEAVAQ